MCCRLLCIRPLCAQLTVGVANNVHRPPLSSFLLGGSISTFVPSNASMMVLFKSKYAAIQLTSLAPDDISAPDIELVFIGLGCDVC